MPYLLSSSAISCAIALFPSRYLLCLHVTLPCASAITMVSYYYCGTYWAWQHVLPRLRFGTGRTAVTLTPPFSCLLLPYRVSFRAYADHRYRTAAFLLPTSCAHVARTTIPACRLRYISLMRTHVWTVLALFTLPRLFPSAVPGVSWWDVVPPHSSLLSHLRALHSPYLTRHSTTSPSLLFHSG